MSSEPEVAQLTGLRKPGSLGQRHPSVSFITLGCAKNEVDTASMAKRLQSAGHAVIPDPEHADVVVVNTCSFIQSATEESIEAILDAVELPRVAAGTSALVVAGCLPARYGDDLAQELPEVSTFVPCAAEDDIVSAVEQAFASCSLRDVPLGEGNSFEFKSIAQDAEESVRFWSYVKISEGCDRFCSYCAIPYIRGRYHSFSYEFIHLQVQDAIDAGAREIVLIAQDTGRWGQDFESPLTLAWLLATLAEAFPQTWFRIMYLQPEGVTDELLEVVATHDNVCSYFDIPLQHVDPVILRAMNRRGDRRQFQTLIQHIRDRVANVTLRTTLIVGFPGETEAQFEELCDFVEEVAFDYVGLFPYSQEEGTAAALLPDQIDPEEKQDRAQRLRDIADAVSQVTIARRIGSTCEVLVEGMEEDAQLFGRTQSQAPEVDGVTYVDHGKPGSIITVRIEDTLLYEMEGS